MIDGLLGLATADGGAGLVWYRVDKRRSSAEISGVRAGAGDLWSAVASLDSCVVDVVFVEFRPFSRAPLAFPLQHDVEICAMTITGPDGTQSEYHGLCVEGKRPIKL